MAWADLFAGLAFYLILEGLFPFVSPRGWRRGLGAMAELNDGQLRVFGLAIVTAGLVLLLIIR
ncbi:MAG: DUF2065 domain-containing protein [Gammaproteobacteria bacterium]